MNTVYIVTAGEYSDYRPIVVCATREFAREFIKQKVEDKDGEMHWLRHDPWMIEEWTIGVHRYMGDQSRNPQIETVLDEKYD